MLTFGCGLLNSVINKLPVELHIPGYQYCGPGTRLKKRLARGDLGINPLDAACREHDIAYSRSNDLQDRHVADKILAEKAWNRVKKSSSLKEKLAAMTVAAAMKAKTKFGMGLKRKKNNGGKKKKKGKNVSFSQILKNARIASRPFEKNNMKGAISSALAAAKNVVKGKTKRLPPRVIQVPKTGGVLPLIPLFAGLSALGALSGGAAGIAKAVNDASAAQKQLQEAARHNKTIEAIALRGKRLYLRPYKKGYGLFLKHEKNCQGGR